MLYHCKVCMHLFKVTLGQILNNFPLFTCHFFPPVFKEVLIKDVFAGVVMIKHLCIKWCHLENNTLSNSGSVSVLLVSTAVTRKYTLTHYMAESTSGQDEASSVFWLAWLTKLVQSRKLDITPVMVYTVTELGQQDRRAKKTTTTTNLVWQAWRKLHLPLNRHLFVKDQKN